MSNPNPSPGIIDSILNQLASYIGTLVQKIADAISFLFGPVINRLASFIDALSDGLSATLSALTARIVQVYDAIVSKLSDVIERVVTFLSDAMTRFLDTLRSAMQTLVEKVTAVVSQVVEAVASLLQKVQDFLTRAFDSVVEAILSVLENARDWLTRTYELIVGAVTDLFERAAAALAILRDNVVRAVDSVLEAGLEVVRAVRDAIAQFVDAVVDRIGSALSDLLATIAELPETLADMARDLVDSAQENIGKPISELAGDLTNALSAMLGLEGQDYRAETEQVLARVLAVPQESGGDVRARMQSLEALFPKHPLIRAVVVGFATLFMALHLPSAVASVNTARLMHGYALDNPHQLLTPDQLAVAWRRGLIGEDKQIVDTRMQGLTALDADVLRRLTRTYTQPGDVLHWFTRGFIDLPTARAMLTERGFNDEDINHLIASTRLIPPVQDLITMAVREAFSPDIAATFGQFEGFPPQFAEHAAKQGLTEEWAQRYWAAHWGLPSPQMGFEMLHRGIIDQPTLELLLRALDVMPFWRDKLVQISYNPLTRVDIRRMHKLGVLSDSDVLRAHLDIGYSPENAARLTQFTLKLNAGDENEGADAALTQQRNLVLRAFREGMFTREQAANLLQTQGISSAVAATLLDTAELQDAIEERGVARDVVVEQAKSGALTLEEARDELLKLGADTGEVQKALLAITRAASKGNKLPTRSELDRMVDAGLITEERWRDTMRRLGYASVWIEAFWKLHADADDGERG